MTKPQIGIVMAPMVFGTSYSFQRDTRRLREYGYLVEELDLFAAAGMKQPRAFPWRANRIAYELNRSASTLRDAMQDAATSLRARCDLTVLMGRSYGGVVALWAAEQLTAPVIGLYPLLEFPMGTRNAIPPDLSRLSAPTTLIYGAKDGTVGDSIAIAERSNNYHIRVRVLDGAGHGFADSQMKGKIPSPLYRHGPAQEAWHLTLKALTALETT